MKLIINICSFAFLKKHLLVFLSLLLPTHSFSQSVAIDKIGTDKGLSDNNILCISQDKNGFVWIGTEWGLNRFDGYSFKVFRVDPGKSNTISSNGINKILVDEDGNTLWLATKGGGLNEFNCSTQEFKHHPLAIDKTGTPQLGEISDLCFDKDGNIWIASLNMGLRKLDKKTQSITSVNLLPKHYSIRCIIDDQQGNIYIGHWGEGFSAITLKDNTVKHFIYDPNNKNGLPGNEILDIVIDSKNNIWLATHWGLSLYRPENETFLTFTHNKANEDGLTDSDIHSIHEINNQLWIGTWRGGVNILNLNEFTPSASQHTQFKHIPVNDLPTGLSSPSIVAINQDSFGNIWLGSYGEGLNVISHIKPLFHSITYSPLKGNIESLSNKTVTSMCHDNKDQIWIGTDNGSIDIYRKCEDNSHYFKVDNLLLEGGITALFTDSKDYVWLGVDKIGLMRYNKKYKLFEKIMLGNNSHFRTYIYSIYEDSYQNIWIGTNDGLFLYEMNTQYTENPTAQFIDLPNKLINTIRQDIHGNIWLGSMGGGITIITPQAKLVQHIPLNHACVYHICKDSKNRMWIASNNGLIVFNAITSNSYSYKIVTPINGFPDNFIRSVEEGETDEIWITSNKGISKYSAKSNEVENFSYHDGIPREMFRIGNAIKTADNMIFFGLQDGVCYFNSKHKITKNELPAPLITNFSIHYPKADSNEESIDIPVTSNISLTYSQNTFTVDFNILDYALKEQIEYAYTLEGINNKHWYNTNGQNQITFRNLSPGKYTLYIKVRIHNQEWSPNLSSLTINIAPPFWLSLWAKLLYTFIIIIIAVLISRFYKRKLDLENQLYLEKQNLQQEQNLNDEKLRFYTNVTHELRTPLTLILGPLEDLEADSSLKPEQTKKISLIHKSAVRLHSLVNQIMEFRKSETHNRILNVTYGNISNLIHEIVLKYKELNHNKDVTINLITEGNIQVYYDKEVMTIILDNIISNALKYTEKGYIEVLLKTIMIDKISYVEIEVNDTGYGIPEDAVNKIFNRYYQVNNDHQVHGSGIGLALVKNLVLLHEGNINVTSQLGKGTSVRVRIKTDNIYPQAIHNEKQGEATKTIGLLNDNQPLLLVVEDNSDIREYVADSFSNFFDIITATDGQEGVRIALERIPDLIISDIMMPVMDGIELCRTLKTDTRTSHIPIILLTAKDTENDKTEGYMTGADSYITKPFSAQLLKSRVSNILQNRAKLTDYFSTNTYKKTVVVNAGNQLDNEFMKKVFSIIENNMKMDQISVAFLAEKLNMSYSTFYRKLKALTGVNANDLIRKVKMQYAEQLLLSKKYTISEIIQEVGYSSRTSFREAFKAEFGVVPSKYIENLENQEIF